MRKVLATMTVLWALAVGGYVGVSSYRVLYFAPADIVLMPPIAFVIGTMAAAAAIGVPVIACLIIARVWMRIAYGRSSKTLDRITLSDVAGIASALHPKAGALLNVAASMEARNNKPQPVALRETAVDTERL